MSSSSTRGPLPHTAHHQRVDGAARTVRRRVVGAGLATVSLLLASAVIGPTASAQPERLGPAQLATATGMAAKPTIADIAARIERLDRHAEIASEALNTARVEFRSSKERLSVVDADLARQRASVTSLRRLLVGSVVSAYQTSSGISDATSFAISTDPQSFVTELADHVAQTQLEAGIVARLVQEQDRLTAQERQAQAALHAIQDERAEIAAHKTDLATRSARAETLLHSLKAARLARIEARQADSEPSRDATRISLHDIPADKRAAIAVSVALAQVGKPYVYGAAGPDSFDCSGLTMYAWGKAGVSLPHSSALQPSYGTPVSLNDLMPGDLIFYYSPISHVGMYIGHGKIVHAPHPGEDVQVVPMNEMPIAEAVRVG